MNNSHALTNRITKLFVIFGLLTLSITNRADAQELPPPIEPTVPPLSEMLSGGTSAESGTTAASPGATAVPGPTPVEPLPPPVDPAPATATDSGTVAVPAPADAPVPPPPVSSPAEGVPAPIDPPITPAIPAPPGPLTNNLPGTGTTDSALGPTTLPVLSDSGGGAQVREFSGDDVGTVLRLLARQAKINIYVSETVVGTITMRLENKTAFEAIKSIVNAKGLFMDEVDNVYYVKTLAEKAAEPQEPGEFRFSYARAEKVAPLLQQQLLSKAAPIVDERTNTVFYREVISNKESIEQFLKKVDMPTKQVMIEARLVEVNANPQQSYGINWSGVLGGAENPKTFRYGASAPPDVSDNGKAKYTFKFADGGIFESNEFLLNGDRGTGLGNRFGNLLGLGPFSQYAILTAPQFALTLRLMNEDEDADFLAHPKVVTSDNQEATIKIVRVEPVPQLTFNAETATSEFSGFKDFQYGNTLIVRPTINKENYITLNVRPEISNKVGDAQYTLNGSNVRAPIVDTRTLDSNVLIRSGDTLAIGGLLQDETIKRRAKVPLLGDIPLIGYAFQERLNSRVKRNLLVFVTPTVVDQNGTGLESQIVTGLVDSREEYADPNGWINNARGSIRLVPSSDKQLTSRYPVPGQARRISSMPGADGRTF